MGLRITRQKGTRTASAAHYSEIDHIGITISTDLGTGSARTAEIAEEKMQRHREQLTVRIAQLLDRWIAECPADLTIEVRIK